MKVKSWRVDNAGDQVNTEAKRYSLKIGSGLFSDDNAYSMLKNRKAVIVTDSNVAPLYGEGLWQGLKTWALMPVFM